MARIGVLTTSYPHSGDEVAGVFVRGMARALAARGHRLEVLAPAPRSGAPPEDDGIVVRHVSYGPPGLRATFYGAGVPDNVRRDVRAWPGLATFPVALAREARRRVGAWDAILSHWALPSALVAGALRGARPHLAVLHSADVHLMRRLPARARWAASVGSSATELLFASNTLREELLSWLAPVPRADLLRRCHACAMGIDPPPTLPSRDCLRRRLGFEGPVLLSVGRLVPIKGLHHAIDAVADREAELVVVGDGPERGRLEAHARRRRARVRFLGVRLGADKAALYTAADAFVAPSVELPSGRTEGTPTAVLEAALAGLPIVASPTGGIREVLRHEESALLVAPHAIGEALRRLEAEPGLRRRISHNARVAGERYLWSELAPRIEELLFRA